MSDPPEKRQAMIDAFNELYPGLGPGHDFADDRSCMRRFDAVKAVCSHIGDTSFEATTHAYQVLRILCGNGRAKEE